MRHLALEKAEKCSAEKLHEKEDKLDFMASTQDEMKLLMKLTAEQNAYELRLLKEANSKVKNDLGQKQVNCQLVFLTHLMINFLVLIESTHCAKKPKNTHV